MSYAKQKGTAFETSIVKFLIENGFTSARRVALAGKNDAGDIHIGAPNDPTIVIECKNYAKELPYKMVEDFLLEAHTEYSNAKNKGVVPTASALLIVKRPNLGITDSWLIWKNKYDITLRARLGDVINDFTMSSCKTEEDCINRLFIHLADRHTVN